MNKILTLILSLFICNYCLMAENIYDGRKSDAAPKTVMSSKATDTQQKRLQLKIAQNTSSSGISTSYELISAAKVHVRIFNILGSLVYEKVLHKNAGKAIDVHETGSLSQGIYMVEFEVVTSGGNAFKTFSRININTQPAPVKTPDSYFTT